MNHLKIKPILVVSVPVYFNMNRFSDLRNELLKSDKYEDLRKDYHILIIGGQEVEKVEFECLNISDIDLVKVRFDEFKKTLEEKWS